MKIPFQLVMALVVVTAAGCSSSSPGPAGSAECRWNRSSCMYEGSYESGERDYAEEEARRLNEAAARRLKGGGWFD